MNSRKQFGRRGVDETSIKRNPTHINPPAQGAGVIAPRGPTDLHDDEGISISTVLLNSLAFLFSFNGRIGRVMYWYCTTFNTALLILLFVTAAFQYPERELTTSNFLGDYYWFLPILFVNGVFGWSVTVRRMHDRGVSGYWILSWFIPLAGAPISMVQTFKNLFFTGTPGHNRYGA